MDNFTDDELMIYYTKGWNDELDNKERNFDLGGIFLKAYNLGKEYCKKTGKKLEVKEIIEEIRKES